MHDFSQPVPMRADRSIRKRAVWSLVLGMTIAAEPLAAAPLKPIDFPDDLGLSCLDSKLQIQTINDASSYPATLASLKQAWANAGHDYAAFIVDDKTALLRFRDNDPPPDEYSYSVKLRQGALVVVAVNIHQKRGVKHYAGTDACIQLFDILHR